MRLTRLFLWLLLGGVGAALIAIPAAWLTSGGAFFWIEVITPTVLLLLAFLLVGFACAVARDSAAQPRLMTIGIVHGLAALLAWWWVLWDPSLFGVYWGGSDDPPLTWPMAATLPTMFALWCAVAGLLWTIRPRSAGWVQLRRIAIIALAVMASHICLVVLLNVDYYSDDNLISRAILELAVGEPLRLLASAPLAYLLGVLGLSLLLSGRERSKMALVAGGLAVAAACATGMLAWFEAPAAPWGDPPNYMRGGRPGYKVWEQTSLISGFLIGTAAAILLLCTLGIAIIARLTRKPLWLRDARNFELDCPRCGESQQGRLGEHHCTRCRLIIRVELV